MSSVSSYAHDLPLQALAELGPAGLFATILALWWVARLVRRGWEANRALAVAVAVVPLHNLLDFSVLLSGVAVPWAVLTGFLRARVEPGPEWRPVPGRIRVAFGIAALAGLVLASLTTASRTFEERAARRGSLADATRAIRIAPWRVRPRLAAADLALDRRTSAPALEEARNAVTTGLRLAPRSAALWLAAARLDLIRGDPLAALAETRAAVDARPGWPPATRFLHRLRSNLRRTP